MKGFKIKFLSIISIYNINYRAQGIGTQKKWEYHTKKWEYHTKKKSQFF